jgi:hypothetical protein
MKETSILTSDILKIDAINRSPKVFFSLTVLLMGVTVKAGPAAKIPETPPSVGAIRIGTST